MNKVLKGTIISIAAAVLFTGCYNTQENYNHSSVANNATAAEVKEAVDYEAHIEKVKKRKKRLTSKKTKKIDLDKFCFEDSSSIHYRAEERCR